MEEPERENDFPVSSSDFEQSAEGGSVQRGKWMNEVKERLAVG